jgi:hypothetical protein
VAVSHGSEDDGGATVKPHIIALCGFANAGKDTVADLLVTHAGFRKLAFADALKAELQDAFSIEAAVFSRPEYKSQPLSELALTKCTERAYIDAALRYGVEHWSGTLPFPTAEELARPRTPRETMQLWGTQYRRAHDPEYWTSIVRRRISYYQAELGQLRIVVTDCRYDNEHDSLRAQGARLWQIKRTGLNAGTTAEGSHSSANEGSSWAHDAVINNAHDLRHLQQIVLQEWWALDAGLASVKAEITP